MSTLAEEKKKEGMSTKMKTGIGIGVAIVVLVIITICIVAATGGFDPKPTPTSVVIVPVLTEAEIAAAKVKSDAKKKADDDAAAKTGAGAGTGTGTDDPKINYSDPVPFKDIQPFSVTPYIPKNTINNWDLIPMTCNNKPMMNNVVDAVGDTVRFLYTCMSGGPVGPDIIKNTPVLKKVPYQLHIADHNMDCGANSVLTGWKLINDPGDSAHIQYTCAPSLRKLPYTTRTMSTPWIDFRSGDLSGLHDVQANCGSNEAINRLQWEHDKGPESGGGLGRVRYNLTCVK